jgi:hypothetical protein
MPMVMENLAIAQYQDTLRYTTIHEGGYQPWVQRFELRDYVYL